MLFRADFAFKSVLEITPDFLHKQNIRGLLLDLDNTLTTHDNPQPVSYTHLTLPTILRV